MINLLSYFPLGDILLCSLHVFIKHFVFKGALYPNYSSSAPSLNSTSKMVLKLNYIPKHNGLWMVGLLRYPCLMTGIVFSLVLEVNLSFQGKWRVHLKHLSKSCPVIFLYYFAKMCVQTKCIHMTSVLGYSSVSKNPLSLEFYGFSRCHEGLIRPIHCHNHLSADQSSLTRALKCSKILHSVAFLGLW